MEWNEGNEEKSQREVKKKKYSGGLEAHCSVAEHAFDIPLSKPRRKSLSTIVIDDQRVEWARLIYRSTGEKYSHDV